METNILVQYRGGGYSGCFWEWNFFCFDKDGIFHDVFSSGRAGIENEKQALDLLAEENEHTYIYDLMNPDNIKEFNNENAKSNIAGMVQWFNEDHADLGYDFFAVCSECAGQILDYDEIILENWHGCGGIMSTADLLLCQECYVCGLCSCCEGYFGGELLYIPDLLDNAKDQPDKINEFTLKAAQELKREETYHICEYCLDFRAEQIEDVEHEDLRFQSFATGNPDMFSDKMRWLWV